MDEPENAIETYTKRSQALLEESPQMGEENTKAKLIQPLLELLGWDVYSAEVELEYPMQIGRGNTRADYALLLDGVPVTEEHTITFWEEGDLVHSFSDANQSDVMAAAVDVLIRDYELVDRFESFPYVPGETTAVLNSKPVHPTGEDMALSRELSSGYYLFTGLDKESKQRYVVRFADLCGLNVEFDGQW